MTILCPLLRDLSSVRTVSLPVYLRPYINNGVGQDPLDDVDLAASGTLLSDTSIIVDTSDPMNSEMNMTPRRGTNRTPVKDVSKDVPTSSKRRCKSPGLPSSKRRVVSRNGHDTRSEGRDTEHPKALYLEEIRDAWGTKAAHALHECDEDTLHTIIQSPDNLRQFSWADVRQALSTATKAHEETDGWLTLEIIRLSRVILLLQHGRDETTSQQDLSVTSLSNGVEEETSQRFMGDITYRSGSVFQVSGTVLDEISPENPLHQKFIFKALSLLEKIVGTDTCVMMNSESGLPLFPGQVIETSSGTMLLPLYIDECKHWVLGEVSRAEPVRLSSFTIQSLEGLTSRKQRASFGMSSVPSSG